MKLHHSLDDIFGSKSKVRVLRLLFRYPEREFTEREIAKMIGMSQNTVNITLAELRKTNILTFRRIGRANTYLVNRKSVLFPFLENIFEGEKNIKNDMIKKLKSATRPFLSCILFGSFAQDTEDHGSDLDLIIIVKDKIKAQVTLEKLKEDMLRDYNIPVSIVLLTPKELINKWNTPYMKDARKNHVIIKGKPLEELYGENNKD